MLLTDLRPDSLYLYQLYDPDVDGPWVEDNGRVIPHPGSLVIDQANGNLYYVVSVDDRGKSTLAPCRLVVNDDETVTVKILSYGNDKFYLYYDDRVKPTKLNIDGKLIVFGSSLVEYRLVRSTSSSAANNDKEVISRYVDSNDQIRGERIPLTDISNMSGAKQLTNCHTLVELQEGDVIEAEIFDNLGILSVTVELWVKRATILNDLSDSTSVIVNFDATSNQMMGTDFYIYQRQDPKHLDITPRLEYIDGTVEDVVVNNKDCFLYGLENFIPTFPGQKQKIMIKKYLNYKQQSTIAVEQREHRYVVCEKIITVVSNDTTEGIKVSVIPLYDKNTSSYYLKYIAYTDRKDKVLDISQYVTIPSDDTKFDGTVFNVWQTHTFDVNLAKIFNSTVDVPYRQTIYIQVKPNKEFQKYLLSDYADLSKVYGVDSSTTRRPVIMYDSTIEQYFIPTSRFANKEAFLESFYYNSNPPFDTNETLEPIVPTHFTVRSLDDLSTLITLPIPIEQYSQSWNIVDTNNPGKLVSNNVIVEFLQASSDNEYFILFGVPVDVVQSSTKYTNYNNIINDLP